MQVYGKNSRTEIILCTKIKAKKTRIINVALYKKNNVLINTFVTRKLLSSVKYCINGNNNDKNI